MQQCAILPAAAVIAAMEVEMKAFRIMAMAAGVVALAGCASVDKKIGEASDSEEFARVCRIAPVAHTAFLLVTTQVKVPAKIVKAEAAAFAVVRRTCLTPPADSTEALAIAVAAYADMLAAEAAADRI